MLLLFSGLKNMVKNQTFQNKGILVWKLPFRVRKPFCTYEKQVPGFYSGRDAKWTRFAPCVFSPEYSYGPPPSPPKKKR